MLQGVPVSVHLMQLRCVLLRWQSDGHNAQERRDITLVFQHIVDLHKFLEYSLQATALVSVSESPHTEAAAAPPAGLQASSEPFAFVPIGVSNDSPQLHVPSLNLNSQRSAQPAGQPAEPHAAQQSQPHLSQQQPQLQHQVPQLPLPREETPAGAAPQLLPSWQHQHQYQFVSQPMQQPPRQLPAQHPQQLEQQQQQQPQQNHLGSIPVTAPPDNHPVQSQYGYPDPQQASQLVAAQGSQVLYSTVPSAVITSGAMGPSSMWTRPTGRAGSPALQAQASFHSDSLGIVPTAPW